MRIAEFSEGGPGGIAEFGFRIAEFSEEELRNPNSAFPRVSNSAKVPEPAFQKFRNPQSEFRISPRLQQRESPGTASKNSAIRNPNSAFPLEVITENIFQDETSI